MVKWTPENDARLFAAVLQVCTVGKAQMTEMAEIIGGDCNTKAIQNRVYFLKQKAKAAEDAGEDTNNTPGKTTKTKGGAGGKRCKKAKKVAASDDGDDDEEASLPAKKVKRDSKVEDGIEVGEDVGEGLRPVVKTEDDDDELV